MRVYNSSINFVLLVMLGLFVSPGIASAGVNLPYSTTYNCSDWTAQGHASWSIITGCGGLLQNGSGINGGSTTSGNHELITSASNYSGGAGGKGQRHWIGAGANNQSEGTTVQFNTPQSEIWVRFYMRYQTGFTLDSWVGLKVLYFKRSNQANIAYLLAGYGGAHGTISMVTEYTDDTANHFMNNCSPDYGLMDLWGGSSSNGAWHCWEVHLKKESASKTYDGIIDIWIDGINRAHYTNANFGLVTANSSFGGVSIGDNFRSFPNISDMYVDFDDVVVSNTGRIGTLGTTVNTPPNAPSGLQVKVNP